MVPAMLTLRDLLEPRGLKLVVGDAADYGRPVEGIHSTDHAHPGDWIEENWIVLTNGSGVRGRSALQRGIVADLHDAGATALGFGVGLHFKRPPPALLDEARGRRFPVFSVPLEVSFVDMVRDVYQATLDVDARSFVHLLAIQHHLIDALGDPDPLQLLLDRVASYVEASVVVVGPEGQVLHATGAVQLQAIWTQLRDRRPMPIELEADGDWAIAVPIVRSGERADKWLVAARGDRFADPRTIKRTLQIAAPLIVAVATLRRAATAEERSLRAGLLKGILDCPDAATAATLASRATAFGLTLRSPWRIVRIAASRRDGALVDDVNAWLEERGHSFLCASAAEHAVALLQARSQDVDALVGGLLDGLGADAIAGVGRPVTAIEDVADSARDALTALTQLESSANGRRALRYEQFDLDLVLFAEVSTARLEQHLRDLLAPLDDRDDLWETLGVYFDHSLDAPTTAAALHLHPNTLRYRLHRIEELIGRPLRSPATIAALEFALRARRASLS